MTTTSIPKVRQLLDALSEDGWANVEFAHTGGGCHAIRICLGAPEQEDWREVLITGSDVFHRSDLDSDDGLDGEWHIGGYDGSGDPTVTAHYDAGDASWPILLPYIVATVNRVAEAVGRTPRDAYLAMVQAFGGGFHPDTPSDEYESLPAGYTGELVDTLMAYAEANGVDLYADALDAQINRLLQGDPWSSSEATPTIPPCGHTICQAGEPCRFLRVCRFCGEGESSEAGPVVDGFHRDANCRIHHENEAGR